MKKFLLLALAVIISVATLIGCKSTSDVEMACVHEAVETYHNGTEDYGFRIKAIPHNEQAEADEEIYCYDLTITVNNVDYRYCCFAVLVDGELWQIDCDVWGE